MSRRWCHGMPVFYQYLTWEYTCREGNGLNEILFFKQHILILCPHPLLHKEVEDTTPGHCSTSFKVLVVSPRFRGKALLQRHRLVNEVLAEEMKHIHAFEQRTLTPEQWAKEKEEK
uniref:BolA-like protein 2 n=1 Tax=Salvator merianae TaxID=96440 RepID=A0A8D0DJR9_SALMN